MNISPETIFFALSGGILPAVLWLWFWLQEDRLHPEPRKIILTSFVAGMLVVVIVLPMEQWVEATFIAPGITVLIWAFLEETAKLIAAYFAALRRPDDDEPIDPVIYMITTALGFTALENTLFLSTSLLKSNTLSTIITGDLRFIGASLLHVLASGAIGVFLGLSFYKRPKVRLIYLAVGLGVAVLLHGLFNFFIINSSGNYTLIAFGFVWVSIVLLLAAIEKVKRISSR
jgi:RsiW-degrading membrane proteinase PrsW (M82 family)